MSTLKDLSLRFFLGGLAIAACYIVLQVIPSKSLAGIFAAFPAVMLSSVIMTGHFESSSQASDVALGATAGMAGCTVCVLTAYYWMATYGNWGTALLASLIVWLISSVITISLIQYLLKKYKNPFHTK